MKHYYMFLTTVQHHQYTFRHNDVLSEMCSHLDKMLAVSPEGKQFADLEGRYSLCGNTIPLRFYRHYQK